MKTEYQEKTEKTDFTICVKNTFNHTDVNLLVEFLEIHRILASTR